jgi:hypothetical protein
MIQWAVHSCRSVFCGEHGSCSAGVCTCHHGYSGAQCSTPPPRRPRWEAAASTPGMSHTQGHWVGEAGFTALTPPILPAHLLLLSWSASAVAMRSPASRSRVCLAVLTIGVHAHPMIMLCQVHWSLGSSRTFVKGIGDAVGGVSR